MTVDGARAHQTVNLLRADPDLGVHLEPGALQTALELLVVPLLQLRRGNWHPPAVQGRALGFLVLDGFLVRRVSLGAASSCELLGPGDVLRPWQNSLTDHLMPPTVRWRVMEPAHLAVIDRRACALIARWPDIHDALVARVARRVGCLSYLMTAQNFVRVEDRLLGALWHLATMWGRVRKDGVLIPFSLTHEMLGQIAGARRPSVTVAIASLTDRNLLARDRHKRLILRGDPPRWEQTRRRSMQARI